jgi:2-amino-4-hydroxy-6-hydroxymethyldihydropteridine diphosphokinase
MQRNKKQSKRFNTFETKYSRMEKIFLGLGSDLGDRLHNLSDAVKKMEVTVGSLICSSSVYETEPWGFSGENRFLNMVVEMETGLDPAELLDRILDVESAMGRVRNDEKYVSRVIDIDILFYGSRIIDAEMLKIPHPRLQQRRFVLVPLNEIAPEFIHPVCSLPVSRILSQCQDTCSVLPYGK